MKNVRGSRTLALAAASAVVATAAALPAWAATAPTGPPPEAPATPDSETAAPGDDAGGGAGVPAAAVRSDRAEDDRRDRRDRRRFGDRTLREGDHGSDVRRLQKILRHLNFKVRVDGDYGKDTKRQVRRFDMWKERRVNGVVHRRQAERMRSMEKRGASYRKHVFPVRGPHDYGGEGSRFGAPRSGHTHQGQDVAAASGTRLVAAHEGKVETVQYQEGGAGHYLVIQGRDDTDSVYMHMLREPRVEPGQRVLAGQKIGRVGSTGSSTGPHLHFELWTPHWFAGGTPFDPLPKLLKWDR
jgi:murein DD-endopeptidase MepM/ murein hydrolase activator NlpD